MKMIAKIILVLIMLVLAAPIFLLNSCGNFGTTGQCGGCPDSAAPAGSSISAPTLVEPGSVVSGTPICYPSVAFQVVDAKGNPLNDICVELSTNGQIALHTPGSASCPASGIAYIRSKTDTGGMITVDFMIAPTATGTYFVRAVSCATSAMASAVVTVL